PLRGWGGIKKSVSQLEPILKKHDVALVQSHVFRESIIGRKIRKAHPDLRHIFRIHTHIDGAKIPTWRKFLYYCLDNRTAGEIDTFVPISYAVRKVLIEKSKVPPGRIVVVPNGIPPIGLPDPKNTAEIPLKTEVAIIGDLQERKQQHLAVVAIAMLHTKGLNVKLHLFGRDWANYIDKIRTVAKEKDVQHLICLHGYQSKERIVRILKDIPVVILPSLFEGVPTSIMEGMSLRKLVITTPVGGTKELVQDGVNGLLHPPQDVDALAKILEKVFTTPAKEWESIRNAGYETWKEKFSLGKMMNGLIKVYRDLGLLDQEQLV
ncbi:MAG: glycosyltransferase family 4 protein, partial [Desulfobacteraceae bacterium]|nr:glycosyltransferase family 4 protein [Desulfobacteraceae bacterium]